MENYITDINGNQIKVTDLKEAIAQAKIFSKFDTSHKENTLYWTDVLAKLRKLALVEVLKKVDAIVVPTGEELLPNIVRLIRAERRERLALMGASPEDFTGKLYIKDGKTSPMFGAHSCVRTDRNLSHLESMEIGESWDRGFGSPKITRIF